MLRQLENALALSSAGSPAKAFWRLGWIGFWTQIGFGLLPVALAVYALIFGRYSGAGTRAGNPLIEYLTIADLLLLAFTTVWSYRYTRLAQQLADPERRPSHFVVQRAAWIGVAAGAAGIVFSMLVMLFEVAQLLIHFLRAPQAGVPVIMSDYGRRNCNLGIRSRHDESNGSDLKHVWRIGLPHPQPLAAISYDGRFR